MEAKLEPTQLSQLLTSGGNDEEFEASCQICVQWTDGRQPRTPFSTCVTRLNWVAMDATGLTRNGTEVPVCSRIALLSWLQGFKWGKMILIWNRAETIDFILMSISDWSYVEVVPRDLSLTSSGQVAECSSHRCYSPRSRNMFSNIDKGLPCSD